MSRQPRLWLRWIPHTTETGTFPSDNICGSPRRRLHQPSLIFSIRLVKRPLSIRHILNMPTLTLYRCCTLTCQISNIYHHHRRGRYTKVDPSSLRGTWKSSIRKPIRCIDGYYMVEMNLYRALVAGKYEVQKRFPNILKCPSLILMKRARIVFSLLGS